MTFLNSKKSVFEAFKNEKKEIENLYDLIKDELAYRVKWIKKAMRINRKSNKNQNFGKVKQTHRSSKENDKGFSKGKNIECFNCGGLRNLTIDCLSPKDIKKSM